MFDEIVSGRLQKDDGKAACVVLDACVACRRSLMKAENEIEW